MAKIITENFKVETTNELFNSFKNSNSALADTFASNLEAYDNTQNTFSLNSEQVSFVKGLVSNELATLRPEANYYIMASTALDTVEGVDSISNTQTAKRDFQRKVIFGAKVEDTSARYMFFEKQWVQGTVYDQYDDTVDLSELNMIATVRNDEGEYLVFKCIDNNNGNPSTINPQDVEQEFVNSNYESVVTSDKYIWHYMFTVGSDEADTYKTTNSLPLPPSGGNINVIANAKDSISQILIEDTPTGQFNQYLFGPATSVADSSDVLIKSTTIGTDGTITITVGTTDKIGRSLYNDPDSYKNMYFRSAEGNFQGRLYEVIGSLTNGLDISLVLRTGDVLSSSPNQNKGQLVPKISVSNSSLGGERCKAYGVLDQFGTLNKVQFETKGSEYKFATAEMTFPKSLTTPGLTRLRVILSPKGGHGSNPINEISMSRLSVVTTFAGSSPDIPDTNTYTQVGLVKNPVFLDASGQSILPAEVDNRCKIVFSGDKTSDIAQNNLVEQFIREIDITSVQDGSHVTIKDRGNMTDQEFIDIGATAPIKVGVQFQVSNSISIGSTKTGKLTVVTGTLDGTEDEETIKGKVHEVKYIPLTHETEVYIVDYYGDFMSKFHAGTLRAKISESTTNATTLNINSFSDIDYGSYEAYSGELLHYIDFSPIQRNANQREKVKFTFDF